MNMKKIISAFCALSMAVTSFAAMAVTANAEGETVLWSDTFDGYKNVVDHYNQSGTLGKVLADGTLGPAEYAGIEGITLNTCGRADGDDSSWFKLYEKADDATDKYLTTLICRFSRQGGGASINFKETYAAEAGKDVVLAFKAMYTNENPGTTYDPGICIGSTFVDLETAGVTAGEWVNVKVVVKTTGTSVYIGDSETAVATGVDTSVSSIRFNGYVDGVSANDAQKSAFHPTGYPIMSLDDVVVYNAADGLASEVPAAETHGNVEITYANAPAPVVPDGMNTYASFNFNDQVAQRLIFMNDGNTDGYTAFSGIKLTVGQDGGDARGETKWSVFNNSKANPELGADLYLNAANSAGSTANRGPQLTINKTVDERETVGVSFATRLHAGTSGPAEVIFSGDLVASASKGNLASPLAMLTTDDEAASGVYACDNPLTKVADGGTNVLEVADNEWVIVTIKATRPASKTVNASIAVTTKAGTEEEATTYILGSADEMVTIQDSTKSGINNLPYITFRSGNDTDYGVSGSSNDIDNLVIYTDGDASMPKEPDTTITDMTISADGLSVTSPTAASETAVVIKATPKADGTFAVEIIKGLEVGENDLTWTNAPVAGDKIMVFNGFQAIMPAAVAPVVIAEVTDVPAE